MAKWAGKIGYGREVKNPETGITSLVITERSYTGDILRNARQMADVSEQIVNDITVNTSISILADAYLRENYFAIRYISWNGGLWTIQKVDVRAPRLSLRLGKVYNGPTAPPPSAQTEGTPSV